MEYLLKYDYYGDKETESFLDAIEALAFINSKLNEEESPYTNFELFKRVPLEFKATIA